MSKKCKYISLVLTLIVAILWLLWGNLTVGVTEISLEEAELPESFHGMRIAHVSDLHNTRLWKQTIRILQKTHPDIICITGDIVDCNRTDVQVALDFVAAAVQIAPCYYVSGNHEEIMDDALCEELFSGMKALGVTILSNQAAAVQWGDEQIQLVGTPWGSSMYQGELSQLEGYRILLAHDPAHFESYAQAGFDLVLSGHVHGGQFRLPFLGGLYGPGQGILPAYDSGVYTSEKTQMVVSRGIGNSAFPVRFANRPEVILITLKT